MTYLLHFTRNAVPVLTIAVITAWFAGAGTAAQDEELFARQMKVSKDIYSLNQAYIARQHKQRYWRGSR